MDYGTPGCGDNRSVRAPNYRVKGISPNGRIHSLGRFWTAEVIPDVRSVLTARRSNRLDLPSVHSVAHSDCGILV